MPPIVHRPPYDFLTISHDGTKGEVTVTLPLGKYTITEVKAPYGFVEDDIHWLVARLFKRGDLSFTVNGESVNLNNRSEEEIIGYITKKQFVDKLLTEVRVRVPENQKKAVRTVMKELFKVAPPADDEDTIMKNFQHYCENRITEIDRLEPKYENYAYPGKRTSG